MHRFIPSMGIPIIESPFLTTPVEETVNRSWKERLFSWPWKPWEATKVIHYEIPSTEVLRLPNGIWVCHPAIAQQLRERLRDQP